MANFFPHLNLIICNLFIFLITYFSYDSYENIEVWLKELKTHSNPDAKVFLIGNKADLEDKRKINKEVANKFKEDYNLDLFMEASAKTGFNAKNVN